jgi:hypothetical protein
MVQPALLLFIQTYRLMKGKDDRRAIYQFVAKIHKVFCTGADEECGQHGSFRKVARGGEFLVAVFGQAPEPGNLD